MTESVRGQEVMLFDGDARVQQGVYQLLSSAGLIVTALGDPAAARKEVADRFFSVVLIDIDTPAPGEGLTFLQYVKDRSPASVILVLAARRTFEMAVRAFRAGAADVVIKEPDQVEYLKRRTIEVASEGVKVGLTRRLLTEVAQVHEEFLKRMMEAARRIVDLEDRIAGRNETSTASTSDSGAVEFRMLVVDAEHGLADVLEQHFADKPGYAVRWAGHGGEALDSVGSQAIHLALVQDALPDLPGSMVVRTIKQLSPDTIVLQITAPGAGPGSVEVVESSRNIPLEPQLKDYGQIVPRINELREAYKAKGRERKYLRAFRAQHFDFIKRYVDIKQRVAEIIGKE
ncbi:MAG TPA: response regulator [Polyangia bacterium]|jgi:DNA-binding NtrC family response regulator